jgi:hypothetical protein
MALERKSRYLIATLLFGLPFAAFAQASKQPPPADARQRVATIQSELDYLESAKAPISFELTDVTIRQAYDRVAATSQMSIVYEGAIDPDSKHKLAFKETPLKEVLEKLAQEFNLTYRVDGPTSLVVVGAKAK